MYRKDFRRCYFNKMYSKVFVCDVKLKEKGIKAIIELILASAFIKA